MSNKKLFTRLSSSQTFHLFLAVTILILLSIAIRFGYNVTATAICDLDESGHAKQVSVSVSLLDDGGTQRKHIEADEEPTGSPEA